MKKVKLGKISVPEFVKEKPVGIRGNGDLIYPSQLLKNKAAPSFGTALASKENKTKLAVERIKSEPDFQLGVLNKVGVYTKKEVIKHIEDQSSLGMFITDVEIIYAEYFTQQLMGFVPATLKSPIIKKKIELPPVPKDWNWIPKSQWKFFRPRVLFCENTTDMVTAPAAKYRIDFVHKAFVDKGFEVILLDDVRDIRSNFTSYAADPKVVYVGGVGHGSYTAYTGHQFNRILEVSNYNPGEVAGKIMHFLSCETGRTLGPDTVSNGSKAYVGYDEDFVFDWANANLYWECDSQFDLSIAEGKTVEQAIADTNARYDAAIASLPGTNTAATLFADKNLLRSPVSGIQWGSKDASIHPYLFYHMSFAAFAQR